MNSNNEPHPAVQKREKTKGVKGKGSEIPSPTFQVALSDFSQNQADVY